MFTQTIPLPEGGGVFEPLDADEDFAGLAGAAAGADAFELAAAGGVDEAGADAEAEPDDEPALEVDAEAGVSALVFLLRLFLVEDVDASDAGAFEESADAALALASAEAVFDRDFLVPVDVSAVFVDAVDVSLDADLDVLEDRDFFVPAASVGDPEAAEVSVAVDAEDLDFFDLPDVAPLLEAEVSVAEESDAAAFFLDLLLEVPALPDELSVALASEVADVFLDFFLLVVLLALLLASDC